MQDHRNHGTRLRSKISNQGFEENAKHVSVVHVFTNALVFN